MQELYFYAICIFASSAAITFLVFLLQDVIKDFNQMDLHDNDTETDKP